MRSPRYRPILAAGVAGVMLLAASCGNDSDSNADTGGTAETSGTSTTLQVDIDGVDCISVDGSVYTCEFDASNTQVIRIDLVDFVSDLSTHGITNDTPLVIQAYGGGALNDDGNVDGGVAQTVTTVSDFQERFGTTWTYLYVGLEGNSKCVEEDDDSETTSTTTAGSGSGAGGSECAYQYGGGTATIVSTVDGSSEADNFDIGSNVVLLAAGAGSGGGSNISDSVGGGHQGYGGAGGVAVSTSASDSNCDMSGASFGALCSPGADGTAGDQGGHKPTTGKGGAMGTGGTGEATGGAGTGGTGGAAYDNVSSGWAGGFSPSYVVDQGIGAGASGSRAKGSGSCFYTGRTNLAFGGSGGGGFGGGGGAHADEACPAEGGGSAVGSGGGASFAMVSTQTYTDSPATPASGDGKIALVFVVPAN